jgi:transmembrane sensor
MSNVTGFTNTDKINQEAAAWILLIEDNAELSDEQIAALNVWVKTSDVHRECIQNMSNLWGEMDLLSSVMLPKELARSTFSEGVITRVFTLIIVSISFYIKHLKSRLSPVTMVPLSLTILALISYSLITQPVGEKFVLQTKVGQQLHFSLDDGSIVWLNSNTKVTLAYTEHFRRIKLLQGEAHFEVAKDTSRPFEVYTNDRLVRALGTAFSVLKRKDSIEVLVTEGKVELAIFDNTLIIGPDNSDPISVMPSTNMSGALTVPSDVVNTDAVDKPLVIKKSLGTLVAGQRVSIPTSGTALNDLSELTNSEITRHLSWREGKLYFAGESLEQVVNEISRHTEVKIDVIDPELKLMRIGGQFKTGDTEALFHVLESGFGIKINRLDGNHVQLLSNDSYN